MPAETDLGLRFRTLRHSRGLSLADVATATDISSSFLSLFETGKSDITFGRLARLIEFFGVSITELIPDPEPEQTLVVRRDGRRHLESPSEHATVEVLAHSRQKMLPVLVNLASGGSVEQTTNPEGGELFLFVFRGDIEIEDGQQEPLRIGKGDAVYVRTDRNRTFRNTSGKPAEWLAVLTPAVP